MQGVDEPVLRRELELAHSLADLAAEITLPAFGDRLVAELKPDDTPVTAADREVEQAIRKVLAERFPADGVLGEEEGLDEGTSGRRWVIDPIDGTRLYAEGVPLWSTLIALEVDERTVIGVADVPPWGTRFHAVAGGGAWRGPSRLSVSVVRALRDGFVAHSPIEGWVRSGRVSRLIGVVERARSTRGLSDAIGQLLVAQGSIEALVEHDPCQPWDWAATSVILAEAGGRLSSLDGAPPAPGSDLLVSNGLVHDELVRVLRGGSDE